MCVCVCVSKTDLLVSNHIGGGTIVVVAVVFDTSRQQVSSRHFALRHSSLQFDSCKEMEQKEPPTLYHSTIACDVFRREPLDVQLEFVAQHYSATNIERSEAIPTWITILLLLQLRIEQKQQEIRSACKVVTRTLDVWTRRRETVSDSSNNLFSSSKWPSKLNLWHDN